MQSSIPLLVASPTVLPVSFIPNIVSQWAATLPLVCHLATTRSDFHLVGNASLAGKLSPGLFPKLGVLLGIEGLLKMSPHYLELEHVVGGIVWDVNWGSCFPCANGAAHALVSAYALKSVKAVTVTLPESIRKGDEAGKPSPASSSQLRMEDTAPPILPTGIAEKSFHSHRRYQTLHVLKFTRNSERPSFRSTLWGTTSSLWYKSMVWVALCGVSAVLCLLSLYGTASALVCGIASQIACHCLQIRRPPGYLENNEVHNACMLVGSHTNCSVWYLYIGDRGVVDALLNKPMLMFPSSAQKWAGTKVFTQLHFLQLLAMTFAAANQGWDAIGMLGLMILALIISWADASHNVKMWLKRDGISIEAQSFHFTGRTPMIGAIHIFSQTKAASWMDSILAPCPRRGAWLTRISYNIADMSNPHSYDERWVDQHSDLTLQAADVFIKTLEGTKDRDGDNV